MVNHGINESTHLENKTDKYVVWGGSVTHIDGVVCWFGWFGCKNDTFSLSHYFPEDHFSLSLMQREKDK